MASPVEANGTVQRRKISNDASREPQQDPPELAETVRAIAHSTVPEWTNTLAIVSLIFGGCCANVFALESIIKEAPSSGTLITCTQFLLTSLFGLQSHIDVSRGARNLWLKPRVVPIQKLMVWTAFFAAVSLLNNMAFDYKISVPLHIILRSAGPVATMGVGYLAGKRYGKVQVLAVALLFLGVVQAAVSDAWSKGVQVSPMQTNTSSQSEFMIGAGLLYLALVLSAVMGVYADRIYAQYGRNNWAESLFYSHTLSLPILLSSPSTLMTQAKAMFASPPLGVYMSSPGQSGWLVFHAMFNKTPVLLLMLFLNAFTQYLCIRGVHLLSAQSSSLTVTIVLNVRKLVSLLLSIWLFGNRLAPGVLLGALLVFIGGGLYALPAKPKETAKKQQ